MEAFLHLEIDLICVAILLVLLYKTFCGMHEKMDTRLFMTTLGCAMLLFLLDGIWMLGNAGYIPFSRQVNLALNAWYFFHSGITAFCWFLYAQYMLHSDVLKDIKKALLCMIPLLVLIFLSVFSVWSGWVFTLDANGDYHRGKLYYLQNLLGIFYLIYPTLKAILYAVREKDYVQREAYISLAGFVAIPALGIVLQGFTGLPILCAAITVGLLLVFIDYQERQISLDPLTQTNNRSQLRKYLAAKMALPSKKGTMFLVILDIDGFKKINDTYGHIEGDDALVRVSGVLKGVCGKYNFFLSRYGGDEFVICGEYQQPRELTQLQLDIRQAMEQSNDAANCGYRLSITMGAAAYSLEYATGQQWVAAADADLYAKKRERDRAKVYFLPKL